MGLELGDLSLSQGVAGEVSPWLHVSPVSLTAGRKGLHYLGLLPLSTSMAVGPQCLICQMRRFICTACISKGCYTAQIRTELRDLNEPDKSQPNPEQREHRTDLNQHGKDSE